MFRSTSLNGRFGRGGLTDSSLILEHQLEMKMADNDKNDWRQTLLTQKFSDTKRGLFLVDNWRVTEIMFVVFDLIQGEVNNQFCICVCLGKLAKEKRLDEA